MSEETFFLGLAPSRNYNPNSFVSSIPSKTKECHVCRQSVPVNTIVYDSSNDIYQCKVNCTPWYGEYNTIHYSLIEDLSEPEILDSVTCKGDVVYRCLRTYKGKIEAKLFSPREIVLIAKRLNKHWADYYLNVKGGYNYFEHSKTIEEYVKDWKNYFNPANIVECRQKTPHTGFGIPNDWPYLVKLKLFNDLVIECEVGYDELLYKVCPIESMRIANPAVSSKVLPCYNYHARTNDDRVIRWDGKLKNLDATCVTPLGKGRYKFTVEGVEYTSQVEEKEDLDYGLLPILDETPIVPKLTSPLFDEILLKHSNILDLHPCSNGKHYLAIYTTSFDWKRVTLSDKGAKQLQKIIGDRPESLIIDGYKNDTPVPQNSWQGPLPVGVKLVRYVGLYENLMGRGCTYECVIDVKGSSYVYRANRREFETLAQIKIDRTLPSGSEELPC